MLTQNAPIQVFDDCSLSPTSLTISATPDIVKVLISCFYCCRVCNKIFAQEGEMYPYYKVFLDAQSHMDVVWYLDDQRHIR
jgi:hypothetical protein